MSENKAKVDRQEIATNNLAALRAKALIEEAAKLLAPLGAEYSGSAVIHYFELPSIGHNQRRFATATQVYIENIDEGFADWGHKELQKALMRSYGREVKDK